MNKYLDKLVDLIKKEDMLGLRELSNKALEEALITENKELIDLSLISYALSKLLGKIHFKKYWPKIKEHFLEILNRDVSYSTVLNTLIDEIGRFDREFGNYLIDIVEKARLKQASRAYALGMSIGRAVELTGCDAHELQDYIGKTKIHERPFSQTKSVRERYKTVKDFFGE